MRLADGVGTRIASLRLAAPDVAARRAQSQVEAAAAFLAPIRLRCRRVGGYMRAIRGGSGEPAQNIHMRTVGRRLATDCVVAHIGARQTT